MKAAAMDAAVAEMLAENERRAQALDGGFDPISGRGSIGPRQQVTVVMPDGQAVQWLPQAMMAEARERGLVEGDALMADTPARAEAVERLRLRHDFAYWAAKYVYVKRKGGGDDCLLRLTHPQRLFAEAIEQMRLAGLPVRIVLLKARQWGGSTVSQLYMAWLQLVRRQGLNSLIIAHQGTASDEIKDMFDRMIAAYPARLLAAEGEEPPSAAEAKMTGVGRTRSIFRVPRRNCKIKIGTAERPDSCRGGDYSLVHLSEVGLWRQTKGKRPEDIVRSACSGVLYAPDTMIVYESTANGVGNFFHREYVDARDNPRSQFKAVFVAWHEIEQNRLPLTASLLEALGVEAAEGEEPKAAFARWLRQGRESAEEPSTRQESGRYLWRLWLRGSTLEGIAWYMVERAKHTQHGSMAAECPTDDAEAFVNSGAAVFDMYRVEALRAGCKPPRMVGDVVSGAQAAAGRTPDSGADALEGVHFVADSQGRLSVWSAPECGMRNRYLAVVDIGGRSLHSDWSVVAVFDRAEMARGGFPGIAAQWYGHTDMDLLAWKAAQIAAYYDNALLVIESNTLETHDPLRWVDGDQSAYILDQVRRHYANLYARRQSPEDIRQGRPRRYGFHTNVCTKPMVVSALVRAVREGAYVERDERCLNEMLTYERKSNGAFGAIIGAHDDLLMTRAIGLHICYNEMDPPQPRRQWQPRAPQQRLF